MQKTKSENIPHLGKFWQVARTDRLPRKFYCPPTDLFDLLEARRSRRKFESMSLQDMSTLLWFTQRHIASIPSSMDRVKTPIPTAGALASVRTIVLRPREEAWLYSAANHGADVLPISIDVCNDIRTSASNFFEIGDGTVLLFFANQVLVTNYYKEPESLIQREAGVLLGVLALVTEALHLSFCPLGTTAEDWLINVLGASKQDIIPAGAAIVGRR